MADGTGHQVVNESANIDLLPKPNHAKLVFSDHLPQPRLITAVSVFAMSSEGILMTRLHSRGWDLPAGHIEEGETPEEAIRRECFEETAAHLDQTVPMGFLELTLEGPRPEAYRYPYPTSYIVSFYGTVGHLEEFAPTEEAAERGFLDEAAARRTQVIQGSPEMYEEAIRRFDAAG